MTEDGRGLVSDLLPLLAHPPLPPPPEQCHGPPRLLGSPRPDHLATSRRRCAVHSSTVSMLISWWQEKNDFRVESQDGKEDQAGHSGVSLNDFSNPPDLRETGRTTGRSLTII